jgi:hypothetical protein
MLSLSIDETGKSINFDGLTDPACKSIKGIPHSPELIAFVDAFMSFDDEELAGARKALVAAVGAEAMVDAVGVASNFQRMVRIADSTAIPPVNMGEDELAEEINDKLGLNEYASATNAREGAKVITSSGL